jgi:hypothetical protein
MITISFELTALEDPKVAQAAASLMLALGKQGGPVPVVEASAPQPVAAAPAPAPAKATPKPAVKAAAAPKPKAKPARRNPAPAPSTGDPLQDLLAVVPERSRAFIDLVRTRGVLSIDDAMSELGISVPKAMGGITGSIGRWAPARGLTIPYEATMTEDGRRAWRWVGFEQQQSGKAPRARKSSKAGGRGKKSSGRGKRSKESSEGGSTGSPPREVAAVDVGTNTPSDSADAARVEALLEAVPESSRRFMEVLREKGRLSMPEVLEIFGLARAKAVGGILEPLLRVAREHGIERPFDSDATATGEKIYLWPGQELEASAPRPIAAAPAAEEKPAPAELPKPREGVIIRKRAR